MVDLSAIPPESRQIVEEEILRLERIIQLKDQQIRLLNLRIWGPKSEKLSQAQLALLPGELLVVAPEIEKEAEVSEADNQAPKARVFIIPDGMCCLSTWNGGKKSSLAVLRIADVPSAERLARSLDTNK